MNRQDLFENILKSLQASVLDDALWPTASALIDEFCGAKGNYLVLCDGAKHDDIDFIFARFCFAGRRDRELEREYFKVYHALDERLPRIRKLPDSQLTPACALFSEEEIGRSEIYNKLLPRIEMRDSLLVRLDGPGDSHIIWGTADPLHGNGWSSGQVEAIEYLLPHLRQFMLSRQALVDASALGSSLVGLLDTVGTGVILLNRRAQVVEANERARALLRRGDAVSDQHGILTATLPEEDVELQRLLGQALPIPGTYAAGGSMLLSRSDLVSRLVLHVNPIGEGLSQRHASRTGALVLLVDPVQEADIDVQRVAALLDLTPAESQVAVSLAQGKTIRDIAAETGRSPTTIRWHIRHIFAKLGVSRQVDLVQLVTSLSGVPGPRH